MTEAIGGQPGEPRYRFHNTIRRRQELSNLFYKSKRDTPLTSEEIKLLEDIGRIRKTNSLHKRRSPKGDRVIRSKHHITTRRGQSSSLGLILQCMTEDPSSREYINPRRLIGKYDLDRLSSLDPLELVVLEGLVSTFGQEDAEIAAWVKEHRGVAFERAQQVSELISQAGKKLDIPSRVHMAVALKAYQLRAQEREEEIDVLQQRVFGHLKKTIT